MVSRGVDYSYDLLPVDLTKWPWYFIENRQQDPSILHSSYFQGISNKILISFQVLHLQCTFISYRSFSYSKILALFKNQAKPLGTEPIFSENTSLHLAALRGHHYGNFPESFRNSSGQSSGFLNIPFHIHFRGRLVYLFQYSN